MIDLFFEILIANAAHHRYASQICEEMEHSSKQRGTGISKRSPEMIMEKMSAGKAIIALTHDGLWAGFCYIESWEDGKFVSNSGLIVAPSFRKGGLARKIKNEIFELSQIIYPDAKIFGLTTSAAVMRINSQMGYEPVIYSEITEDEKFWDGCKSCVNYEILISKGKKNCFCTAMLFEPMAEIKEMSQPQPLTQLAS